VMNDWLFRGLMFAVSLVVVGVLVLVVVALFFGASTAEVRVACTHHGGVSSVNGNAVRKYVACRDGTFKTVR
jgi:hypothetical protein